ncbi:hypothetical protein TBLA_0H03730 [Henningerozyma blattae CBS 6284]|uniref:MBA1-like protein n=1 Tax=Henningerozyma blattae (strain ATCC 34711 / CBS 6284 / DSM 70876 / NBRC 10599 / NRRL Y-10934 / UCD 77-7) TaxID=1071380 RepID=I2H8F3_HENB6|nr:hypothetical protein TBLA_0H03730 [Tetrapisispora blattae CBS 6284]CCH62655.1 hypothetical protein TBLA_0H03730 [Tetrapisispora blattae CBS 6284]
MLLSIQSSKLLIQPFVPLSSRRSFVITRYLLNDTEKNISKLAAKSQKKKADKPIGVRNLGVATQLYIPPTGKSLVGLWKTHPKLYLQCVFRRMFNLGLNTIQIAVWRHQTGLSPQFALWRTKATKLYADVHSSFAKKSLAPVNDKISIWVQDALSSRLQQLPRSVSLDWKLLKFHKVPKIVSLQCLMIPGTPLEYLQIVYRFETRQRLIRFDKITGKTEKYDRDVVDNMAFICQAETNKVYLIGSVFESKPTDTFKRDIKLDNKVALTRIVKNADIYRVSD